MPSLDDLEGLGAIPEFNLSKLEQEFMTGRGESRHLPPTRELASPGGLSPPPAMPASLMASSSGVAATSPAAPGPCVTPLSKNRVPASSPGPGHAFGDLSAAALQLKFVGSPGPRTQAETQVSGRNGMASGGSPPDASPILMPAIDLKERMREATASAAHGLFVRSKRVCMWIVVPTPALNSQCE
jgi:hypothetical protein